MWYYEKRLEYPVNITTPNPKLASVIISQYGGPYPCTRWVPKNPVKSRVFRHIQMKYQCIFRPIPHNLFNYGSDKGSLSGVIDIVVF